MNADNFASSVIKRLNSKTGYADVHEWRAAWWSAWLGRYQDRRIWEDDVNRLCAINRRGEESTLAFWNLFKPYLDAATTDDRREAARALVDFMDAWVGESRWNVIFHWYMADEDNAYTEVMSANRWVENLPERHAGACYARMKRIAQRGSPDPLDSEEAEWMLLDEWRYFLRCQASSYGSYNRNQYAPLQHRLHAQKWIAIVDALEHVRDAELIGDTDGATAAHHEFETAMALFGGNIEGDTVIWANQLDDTQRAAWERWQAENPGEYVEYVRN